MRATLPAVWLSVALAFPTAVDADLVTIGFESVASGVDLDDEYALTRMVDFGGTMRVLNSSLARTGAREAFGPPFGADPSRIDALGGEFLTFGAWFRGDGAGDVLSIDAFNASDSLLGTVSFNTPASGLTHGFLEIDTADTGGETFAYVEISITGVGYSMDDLQFEIATAVIPEASPLVAFAIIAGSHSLRRGARRVNA